jgi:cytochrome-b5 reductase
MTTEATRLPPKPEPPNSSDCCGGGCQRCVLDVYEERLAEWREAVAWLAKIAAASERP